MPDPKKKPIIVESKNDPRYRAYQDSLSLYNYSNKNKKYIGDYLKKKDKENPSELLRNLDKNTRDSFNGIAYHEQVEDRFNKIKPVHKTNVYASANGIKDNLLFTVPFYKKPQQPVIITSNKSKEKGLVPDKEKEYTMVDNLVSKKDGKILDTEYTNYKRNTPQVTPLQPMSVGLQNNNQIQTNLNIPIPTQRQPSYYDVRDVNHQNFGGTDTQYRVDNLKDLRELPKEQWTRTTTPHYSLGGNMNNMNRYAEGGTLNQFNEGGTHEQNPNGGIPQGPNATVEQGETSTKTPNGKYIYSNRLYINEDLVKQFNLPNSIKGKTFADASKIIDKPFKDKNSNPDKLTHKEHLDRLKQAQETLKAEEAQKQQAMMQNMQQMPDVSQNPVPEGMEEYAEGVNDNPQEEQMEQPQASAYGGFIKRYAGGGELASNGLLDATSLLVPGFGEASQVSNQLGNSTGNLIGGDHGHQLGNLMSPLGTVKGIGQAIDTKNINDIPGIGLLTGREDTFNKQYRLEGFNNARNANSQFSDKFAGGGYVKQYKKGGILDSLGPVPTADMNTNVIQNIQDGLGMDPKTPGYGTAWGSKTKQSYFNDRIKRDPKYAKWAKDNNATTSSLTKKDMLESGYNEAAQKRFGITPQGYKYNDPEIPDTSMLKSPEQTFVEPTGVRQSMEDYYQKNKTTTTQNNQGSWLSRNGGKMLKYAPVAMNAYQLSQLKKPQGVTLDRLTNRYKPTYMDEASMQNNVSNEMNNTVAGLTNATAGSESALRANLVGANVGRIRGMNDAYSKMREYNAGQSAAGQQFNLGVDQANIGQSNNEKDINAANQATYRNEKSKYLGAIGTDLGSIGKEEVNKNQLAEALGYTWDGQYYIHKNTGEKLTAQQLADKNKTANTTAYGGFINNKIGR